MSDILASLGGSVASFIVLCLGALMIVGLPLALFEGLFGRGCHHGKDGPYRQDRSAQELYERRLRDSRRR